MGGSTIDAHPNLIFAHPSEPTRSRGALAPKRDADRNCCRQQAVETQTRRELSAAPGCQRGTAVAGKLPQGAARRIRRPRGAPQAIALPSAAMIATWARSRAKPPRGEH